MDIPVYIFTGQIDSGKTTLIRDTLESPDFDSPRNLILVCEDGDEEFSPEYLKKNRAFLEKIDSKEALTAKYLKELAAKYDPTQVFIEYNGMWPMNEILDKRLPKNWDFYGIYSTADGSTINMYLDNMRQLFMEQFSMSGLVIINRTNEDLDRIRIRRIFRTFNPQAQLIFEKPDGEVYDPSEDPLPYDITADVIEVEDSEFGVWYLDAMDHPERYEGKHIKFLAQVYRGNDLPPNSFVPGRFIMTCCVNDVKFMGYRCEYEGNFSYKLRDWVRVEVAFDHGYDPDFGQDAPQLKLVSVMPAQKPEQDPIYFN